MYTKISRRREVDLSTVAPPWCGRGRLAHRVRPVAPTPCLVKTEELLRGKKLDGALIEQAAELAKTEVAPIDDVRASKEYRVTIVGLIVKRSLEALAK
ncbi:MAG: hypothetical protein ACLVL7_12360 [Anaerotruncus massiliensis (ex Togo et al. 2019)]